MAERHPTDLTSTVIEQYPSGGSVVVYNSINQGKINEGKKVTEVWIRDDDTLNLIYENTNGQLI